MKVHNSIKRPTQNQMKYNAIDSKALKIRHDTPALQFRDICALTYDVDDDHHHHHDKIKGGSFFFVDRLRCDTMCFQCTYGCIVNFSCSIFFHYILFHFEPIIEAQEACSCIILIFHYLSVSSVEFSG